MVVAIGLCWNIYHTTSEIDAAFSAFTDKELRTLEHILKFRASLGEHERLLYEYYATVDREPAITRLAVLRNTLEQELVYLQNTFDNNEQCQILAKTYEGFSYEYKQLDNILTAEKIDWNAARESLAQLTRHGQAAIPALDELFQAVGKNSEFVRKQVEVKLMEMVIIVTGFVILVLAIILMAGYFIREMLIADNKRKRLAYFPERSPIAVFRLSSDGTVEYQNPASHRIAAQLDVQLETVLPPEISTWTSELRDSGKQSHSYEYTLCDHILSANLQYLPDLRSYHLYISDVTEQRKAEKELHYLAYYDPISDLPSRRSFLKECENWINKGDFAFSVVMIGFHRFEIAARDLGMDVVDELIKQIGQRLLSVLMEVTDSRIKTAQLYRFSGASFIILLQVHDDSNLYNITEHIADSLLQHASNPIRVQRREVCLRPEIGASFYPGDAVAPAQLLGNASAAIAHLMKESRHGYQPVTPEIMRAEHAWHETETAMRQGLERGEFCLYYQPKINLINRQISGMEALVRWNRRDRGFISPMDFIPVAEESGLIVPLGTWVLDEACHQMFSWQKLDKSKFSVAVNISRLQFQQDNFITLVESMLHKHELNPEDLELEITESMLMQDLTRNLETLNGLRQLGIGLSLDDFGTGYSSLGYLRQFPVTQLKIDKSFIDNIASESRERAIVRTIIQLAHQLDMTVVAEGVETEQQAEILSGLGCDELQGYYFSKPLAAQDFEQWRLNFE